MKLYGIQYLIVRLEFFGILLYTVGTMDKRILRLIWAVKGPIIVPRKSGWPPPDTLRELVPLSRIEEALLPEKEMASDVEALIYIHCASMEAPLESDWVDIMMYLFTKVMKRYRYVEVPKDLRSKEELPEYLMRQLEHLKRWLYKKSMEHVKELLRNLRSGKRIPDPGPDLFTSEHLLPEVFDK